MAIKNSIANNANIPNVSTDNDLNSIANNKNISVVSADSLSGVNNCDSNLSMVNNNVVSNTNAAKDIIVDNTNISTIDSIVNDDPDNALYKHYIKRAKKLMTANFASIQSAQDMKTDEFNHLHSFYNKKSRESKKLRYVDLKRVKYSEFKLNEQRVYALNYLLDNSEYAPIFLTITLPSSYHPFKVVEYAKSKKQTSSKNNIDSKDIQVEFKNQPKTDSNFNGCSKQTPIYDKNIDGFDYECFKTSELKKIVQKGYDKLNDILRHINKQLSFITNGNCYYVNAIEPHKTFIPHAHCLIYVPIKLRQKAIDYIARHLNKNGGSYDIKALMNDSKKASSYLIKYINKTFNDDSILGYYYLIKMRPFRISNLDRLGLISSVDFSKIYKSVSKAQKSKLVELAKANNTNLYIEVSKNASINEIKSDKIISIFKRQSVKSNADNLKIKSSLKDMLNDATSSIKTYEAKLDKSMARLSKKVLMAYGKISDNQDIINGILGNIVACNDKNQSGNNNNSNGSHYAQLNDANYLYSANLKSCSTYSQFNSNGAINYRKLKISKALHLALTNKDMLDYFKQVKKDILADLFDANSKIRLNRSYNRYKIFFKRKIIYNLQDSQCLYLFENTHKPVDYADEIINQRFYKNLNQPTHFSSYDEQNKFYEQKRLEYAKLEEDAQSGLIYAGEAVVDF